MSDREREVVGRRKIKISHILIILVAVCITLFAIFRLRARFRFKQRIELLQAAGYPVTCSELDQWYSIPADAENAAYTYEDAFAALNNWDKEKLKPLPVVGRADLPPRTESLPSETKVLMEEYIADNNEAIALLHEGAKIEYCRYPIDLSAGLATLMPNLSEMRGCVFMLELDAILHADNGDIEDAIRSINSAFGIARSLSGQPVTLSQLVRSSCQVIAIRTIEQISNRVELSDEQLTGLIESVRKSKKMCDMTNAIVGERCMGLSLFKNPRAVDPSAFGGGVPFRPLLALYQGVGLSDADGAIYLDLMGQYVKAANLPTHERQKASKDVEEKYMSTSKIHVMLHMMMPAISRITTLDIRSIAHHHTAVAALAVQRYRLANGKLPDKLSDLIPNYLESIPKDPYDNNEIRYKKLNPGYVIYSIGEDLSDDGGKEKPKKTTKDGKPVPWDITFRVER